MATMFASLRQKYSLLTQEEALQDDAASSSNSIEDPGSSIYRNYLVQKYPIIARISLAKLVAIQITILVVYTLLLGAIGSFSFPDAFRRSSNPFDLRYTVMHDAYRYEVREVDYNFETINPFKGAPIEEIEESWSRLLNGAHTLQVPEVEMEKMNMSSIQMNDGSGDYLVLPISYHMLHCIYQIYRYAHPDFYGEDPRGPEWIVTHTDHCVDNLRQFVQCHVGTGFQTYTWLDTRKPPWFVTSTEEVCVDWTHFDGWLRERSIPAKDMTTLRNGKLISHPKYGPVYEADWYNKTVPGHDHQ